MKKTEWKEFLNHKYVILDGATGSNLMKAGMPIGVCPEEWILEHPEVLIQLQKQYIAAGSDIIYAPTFTANRIKLKEYGLQDKQEEMILGLVNLSRQAAEGSNTLIAGDLTMTGKQLAPVGDLELEELIDVYKEQVTYLVKAGVDLLVIETMMSLAETRAAVIAAREVCELPVMVTMSFEAGGRTLFGTDARTAAVVLEGLGVDALGVNCSAGPSDMIKIIRKMREAVSVPLIAKPNAGLPKAGANGTTVYDMAPDIFAEQMKELIMEGAVIVGGCCGTDPTYIAGLKKVIESLPDPECVNTGLNGGFFAASERRTLFFAKDEEIAIGNLINTEINPELQEELSDQCLDSISDLALDQEDDEAQILNLHLYVEGLDEADTMLKVLEELSSVTNLPLAFSTANVAVLETALRNYPGKALVDPTYIPEGKFAEFAKIALKYGAVLDSTLEQVFLTL